MLKLSNLLVFAVLGQLFASEMALAKASSSLTSRTSFYQTEANYRTEGGSFENLNSGRNYSLILSEIYWNFALDRRWLLSLDTAFAKATSDDSSTTKTNTNITHLGGKLTWHPSWRTGWKFYSSLRYPLERVDSSTTNVLVDEGAVVITAGGSWRAELFGTDYADYSFVSDIGLSFRDEGRSHLLPWKLGLESELAAWVVTGGLSGAQSITDDEFTDNPSLRTTVTDAGNAGSLKFYSVNPDLVNFYVGAEKLWHNWKFGIEYTQDINGKSAAAGWEFAFAATYLFKAQEPQAKVRKKTKKKRKAKYKKRTRKKRINKEFEVDTEEVDVDIESSKSNNIKELLDETENNLED